MHSPSKSRLNRIVGPATRRGKLVFHISGRTVGKREMIGDCTAPSSYRLEHPRAVYVDFACMVSDQDGRAPTRKPDVWRPRPGLAAAHLLDPYGFAASAFLWHKACLRGGC